ncbi:Disease resistance protein [Vitis vinifera]|uniref:Disease resistance protein n=1 Tax=Vitis vinifera TaxID=29760 RepID=A0A438EZP5_VITVI|nr:Disease resistance protein [Vitis vinifera]
MAEILISIAAKVAEYLVAPIVRPLGYLFNYRSNLDNLEEQVDKLGDARERRQRDVDDANRQGDEIEPDVQKWLTRTEGIIQTAKELIEDEKAASTSCFNLKLRYQRSRQAKKQSGDIGGRGIGKSSPLKQKFAKNKTVLVILDDIWEELSLENIGIPHGDAHRGCKVLLTSRKQGVLSRKMATQKNFRVQHLCEEEAWSLFKKTAGVKSESDEAVWNNALLELENSAAINIEDVHEKVYSCLELSYNHLKGDEVKRLFLLCGVGPGVFFGNNDENKFVRMHDVVGDVARAIAAKDPHRFVVIKEALGLEEWQRKEEFRNCSRISLQCGDLRELPERLDTKHVLYEFDTDDFLQLKHLVIGNCPGIQYIVDSTKGVPSHSALPILEELRLGNLYNMDAVCYGPIPEGSFGKLRSLLVIGCKRLKSFISLPMEQGKNGSVLPEMGSLDSTRDFSSTGSSATQELCTSDVPTPFFNEQYALPP